MRYTDKHLQFISRHKHLPRAELTDMFNARFGTHISLKAMIETCKRYGYLCGRTGQFLKNSKPWNASLKGKGICKPNSGSFCKGNRPVSWRPVGSERVNVHGYIEIKVEEPGEWRRKHNVIWEAQHGKLRRGYVVRFKDNNPLNCNLDNLEMVIRRVHFRLNQIEYAQYPMKLKPSVMALTKLEVKIFERQKER